MSGARRLILGSANRHKVKEIERMLREELDGVEFELLSAADFPDIAEPEETGETFEANALLKARYYAEASGLPALADDSGLAVDALGGRPGIYSARYAETSAARNQRVLDEMKGVEEARRGAHFICVMALADPEGRAVTREGRVDGKITHAVRGEGGFGYDPIFELTETEYAGQTTAEISAEAKNALSHRGRALRAIAPAVRRSLLAGCVSEELME